MKRQFFEKVDPLIGFTLLIISFWWMHKEMKIHSFTVQKPKNRTQIL